MALGPNLEIGLHASEAAEAADSLREIDRLVVNLEKSIEGLGSSGGFDSAIGGADALGDSLSDVDTKAKGAAAGAGSFSGMLSGLVGGGLLSGATTALKGLADKFLEVANFVHEFAGEGAIANDVAARFTGNMQRLNASVAGTLDETTIQRFFEQFQKIGLAEADIENLNKRMTELTYELNDGRSVAEGLKKILEGSAEGMREYGVVIDVASEQFQGLSESQKKLAIALEFANQGKATDLSLMNSQAMAMDQAETQYANFISTLQGFVAETVMSEDVLGTFSELLDMVADLFAENKDVLLDLIKMGLDNLKTLMPVISSGIKLFGGALKIVIPILEIFNEYIEYTIWPAKKLAELLGDLTETKIPDLSMVSDEAAGSLQRVKDNFFGAGKEAEAAAKKTDKYADALSRVNKEAPFALANKSLAELRDKTILAANGAQILADSVAQSSKSYEEALQKLGEVEDATAELGDSMLFAAHWSKTIEDAQILLEQQYNKTEKATKKSTAAMVEHASVLDILIERYGALFEAGSAWEDKPLFGTWEQALSNRLDDFEAQVARAYKDIPQIAAQAQEAAAAVVAPSNEAFLQQLADQAAAQESIWLGAGEMAIWAFDTAIKGQQSFGQILGSMMGQLFGKLSTAFMSAAFAEQGLLSGNPLGAIAAAVALGVAAAALSNLGNRGKSGGKAVAPPKPAPTRLATPKSANRSDKQKETTIIQLMVDGRKLGEAAINGANKSVAGRSGIVLNSKAVGKYSRLFAA